MQCVLTLCLLYVARLHVDVDACTPTEPLPLVQRVHIADVVLHGAVSALLPSSSS